MSWIFNEFFSGRHNFQIQAILKRNFSFQFVSKGVMFSKTWLRKKKNVSKCVKLNWPTNLNHALQKIVGFKEISVKVEVCAFRTTLKLMQPPSAKNWSLKSYFEA